MLTNKYQWPTSTRKKNLADVNYKNPNQCRLKNSHSRCQSKNLTNRHWLKTLTYLNQKIILPKIDQKHHWLASNKNALTDIRQKIILVDVDLKMFGSMSIEIVLVEVGRKYLNQNRSKIILWDISSFHPRVKVPNYSN